MKKKNLLITGGLGLIGKSLIKILLEDFNLRILDTKQQVKRHKNYIKGFNKSEVKFISGESRTVSESFWKAKQF